MKKTIALFLAALTLTALLCSCSGDGGAAALAKTLAYPAELSAETGELAFTLTVSDGGASSAVMTSPRTLSGLVLQKSPEGVSASYKGMTVPLPEASARKVFMLDDIVRCISSALADGTAVHSRDGDLFCTSAPCGDGVCTVIHSGDGNMLTAEMTVNGKKSVYNIIQKEKKEESSANAEETSGSRN